MRVLVACEESQTVCKAFRERAHEAYSCDILPCSGGHPEWHLQGDVVPILSEKWDMIIAFPPCTFISNAGACRLYPTKGNIDKVRYEKGLLAKEFFLTIFAAACPKIAIENPVSSKVFNMPKHSQELQPFHFGHPYTKKTRLWLKGLKPLIPSDIVTPIGPYVPAGTGRKDRSKYGSAKRGEDAKNRSKTFPGVARAMAQQWG